MGETPLKVGVGNWVLNAQSTVSVVSGRNTIHQTTSQSNFTVPDTSQSLYGESLFNVRRQLFLRNYFPLLVWRCLGENEVE